jgi:hypothetical protein
MEYTGYTGYLACWNYPNLVHEACQPCSESSKVVLCHCWQPSAQSNARSVHTSENSAVDTIHLSFLISIIKRSNVPLITWHSSVSWSCVLLHHNAGQPIYQLIQYMLKLVILFSIVTDKCVSCVISQRVNRPYRSGCKVY